MRKIRKMRFLGFFAAALTANVAIASDISVIDYLNSKNVSFLAITAGDNTKLTTFDWMDAAEACKTIKLAGFSIVGVRNVTTLGETAVKCD